MLLHHMPGTFGTYIEPFAGSACLYFRLAPPCAVLGDINHDLISFYGVLANRRSQLLSAIQGYAPDGSDYYSLRATSFRAGSVAAAARFLYLNRFSFNGVYRTNRSGTFNVPRGKHTGAIPSEPDLIRASRLLKSATRVSGDFSLTLAHAKRGDFVFLDPPYARRRSIRSGEYGCGSLNGEDDLDRLATALAELSRKGVRYLLSYMRSQRALDVLPHCAVRYVRVRRNVGGFKSSRRVATEMLLANYDFR